MEKSLYDIIMFTDSKQPLVSIITPTYNSERFIGETIEHIVCQTYQNWEMLIVDDGSIDNTLEIAKDYAKKDPRIKVFVLGYNSGRPAVPRNYGIKHAQGNYIAFLDSDDIWLPEKLEKQVEFMEKNKDIFLVYSKCFVKEKEKIRKIIPQNPQKDNVFISLFLSNNFIPCVTVMMRNIKAEERIYFFDEDKRLKAIEDYDLWLTIALKEEIGFINEPLAIYNVHKGNTSAGFRVYFNRYKLVIKKYRKYVPLKMVMIKYLLLYVHMGTLLIRKIA